MLKNIITEAVKVLLGVASFFILFAFYVLLFIAAEYIIWAIAVNIYPVAACNVGLGKAGLWGIILAFVIAIYSFRGMSVAPSFSKQYIIKSLLILLKMVAYFILTILIAFLWINIENQKINVREWGKHKLLDSQNNKYEYSAKKKRPYQLNEANYGLGSAAITGKYPCLLENVEGQQIPEISKKLPGIKLSKYYIGGLGDALIALTIMLYDEQTRIKINAHYKKYGMDQLAKNIIASHKSYPGRTEYSSEFNRVNVNIHNSNRIIGGYRIYISFKDESNKYRAMHMLAFHDGKRVWTLTVACPAGNEDYSCMAREILDSIKIISL